jgi:hypothetical protein
MNWLREREKFLPKWQIRNRVLMLPDQNSMCWLKQPSQIAQSRVNAGVHNPSEINEGEILGKATGAAIVASPAFQADLAQVRSEV